MPLPKFTQKIKNTLAKTGPQKGAAGQRKKFWRVHNSSPLPDCTSLQLTDVMYSKHRNSWTASSQNAVSTGTTLYLIRWLKSCTIPLVFTSSPLGSNAVHSEIQTLHFGNSNQYGPWSTSLQKHQLLPTHHQDTKNQSSFVFKVLHSLSSRYSWLFPELQDRPRSTILML